MHRGIRRDHVVARKTGTVVEDEVRFVRSRLPQKLSHFNQPRFFVRLTGTDQGQPAQRAQNYLRRIGSGSA